MHKQPPKSQGKEKPQEKEPLIESVAAIELPVDNPVLHSFKLEQNINR